MGAQVPIVGLLSAIAFATVAYADRPVTAEEQGRIAEALQAQSCGGGEVWFDDESDYFKVEDARCEEGRLYELTFDQSFVMLEKTMERHAESVEDDEVDADDDEEDAD
jgi:hypothetical protein